MRGIDFALICKDRTIDPEIALENDAVREFLKKNKGNNTITCQLRFSALLDTEF